MRRYAHSSIAWEWEEAPRGATQLRRDIAQRAQQNFSLLSIEQTALWNFGIALQMESNPYSFQSLPSSLQLQRRTTTWQFQ
jgi:hypothetical protein